MDERETARSGKTSNVEVVKQKMSDRKDITRRDFLRQAGAASLGLALAAAMPSTAAGPDKRPNILFVIADDWSFPHAGVYGDNVIKTPNFDKVAASGVIFTNSYCAAPTCTGSRGAILTGQHIHRLDEGANLYGFLPKRLKTYPDILEAAGYTIGLSLKGHGPHPPDMGGRTRNPAGPSFPNFRKFLEQAPADKPFCFWWGSHFPHRDYKQDSGINSGMRLEDVKVPGFLPDTPEVRGDILDYYFAAQRFDQQLGECLDLLDEYGKAENTLVVVTSDNGMAFPRSKGNLYGIGTHMPLAVRWPGKIKGGKKVAEVVSHTDFAPTFLEAAGIKPPTDMTGRSMMDLLLGNGKRDFVVTEKERHVNCREGDRAYPCRAIRTRDFVYIRNLEPDLWPAGDPKMWKGVGDFGDIDTSPTKDVFLERRDDPKIKPFFDLATAKRPAEELYDVAKDPWELHNLADDPKYGATKRKLREKLDEWRIATEDPRILNPHDNRWDKYEYTGNTKPWINKGARTKQ